MRLANFGKGERRLRQRVSLVEAKKLAVRVALKRIILIGLDHASG